MRTGALKEVVGLSLASELWAVVQGAFARQLVLGKGPTWADFADVTGDIVTVLTSASIDTAQKTRKRQPIQSPASSFEREFSLYIGAGRRHLRDLGPNGSDFDDRELLLGQARQEFSRASALAETEGDIFRYIQAEVAIAGCWQCVPRPDRVHHILRDAYKKAAENLRSKDSLSIEAFNDVVALCALYKVELRPGKFVHEAALRRVATDARLSYLATGWAINVDRQQKIPRKPTQPRVTSAGDNSVRYNVSSIRERNRNVAKHVRTDGSVKYNVAEVRRTIR